MLRIAWFGVYRDMLLFTLHICERSNMNLEWVKTTTDYERKTVSVFVIITLHYSGLGKVTEGPLWRHGYYAYNMNGHEY